MLETVSNDRLVNFEDLTPWGDWEHYHNYTEIVNMLLYLNSTYPDVVDVFSIGKSWQNREIYCIRLTNENVTHFKPEVFFVGYHHGSERIGSELPLYFAVEAATSYATDASMTYTIDNSEIYIVTALNVDALEAVKSNDWQRKNLHPYDEDGDGLFDEDPPGDVDGDGHIGALCRMLEDGTDWYFIGWEGIDDDGDGLSNEDWVGGVDLNRNYGYAWNLSVQTGSTNPQEVSYKGPMPFSEPETQAIRDLALQHDFRYALSFHSGTNLILYPWAYTDSPAPHNSIFREVAAALSSLVDAPCCQSGAGLYTSSGDWKDWMYANCGTLAFGCEIYGNNSALQFEAEPYPNPWWMKGASEYYNPEPENIEKVVLRWLPVFTYLTSRAIKQADLNRDGVVNILDISMVATSFGSHAGDDSWNEQCDLNLDNVINILDLTRIAAEYGKQFD